MGVYVIWKFAKNKEAARKYLVDQQLGYREHFIRSQYYNFPPWNGLDQGRLQVHPPDDGAGHAQAEGQVHGPDDDRREVHDEPRPSGQLDPGRWTRSTTRS